MNLTQSLEKLYLEKNYTQLFQELNKNNDEQSLYLLGKIYFLQSDFDTAIKYFEKCGAYCDAARCTFFKGNIRNTRNFLKKVKEQSILSEWLCFLTDLIENKVKKLPTFFQVRNFLEVDLSLLFEIGNIDFAEIIINASDYFVQANAEANKFFARVLYNYNYVGLSQIFLDKSLEIYYKDPETHFIKAQCYLTENKKDLAIKHFNYCLESAEDYFPAKKMLKELEKEGA